MMVTYLDSKRISLAPRRQLQVFNSNISPQYTSSGCASKWIRPAALVAHVLRQTYPELKEIQSPWAEGNQETAVLAVTNEPQLPEFLLPFFNLCRKS